MNKKFAIISILVIMIAYLGFGIYTLKSGRPSLFTEKLNKEKRLLEIEKVNAEIKEKFETQLNVQASAEETNKVQQPKDEVKEDLNQETKVEDTYSKVQFTRNLAQGVNGDDVKKLQYILKNKGYYQGEITGLYDMETMKAVKNFQKDLNIRQTGIVGPATMKELEK